MKFCLITLLIGFSAASHAQQISVSELYGMLDWQHHRIDTTLKKKGYLLMQKDLDSLTSIYQYSHLDHKEQSPTTVRSFAYMDAKAGNLQSRLITYRTYSEEEYVSMARWLLENGFQMKEKYDFSNEKHTVYTNGKETVRVKVITTKLDSTKVFTSYELELGK
jgi:hypothetical protein